MKKIILGISLVFLLPFTLFLAVALYGTFESFVRSYGMYQNPYRQLRSQLIIAVLSAIVVYCNIAISIKGIFFIRRTKKKPYVDSLMESFDN